MRFLRVLGLGLVLRAASPAGSASPKRCADQPPAGAQRLARELHAVGAHVGDQADRLAADVDALEQALGGLHRAVGREAELARRLLLQGRGAERRRRVAADLLLLDRARPRASRASISRTARARRRLVAQRELVQPLAVELGQPRREGRAPRASSQQRLDGPVFLRPEGLDLGLALADQAQRHRLHAAGRARARLGSLRHSTGDSREADQIVERAARLVGVDQVRRRGRAAVAHRLEHGGLGDLVEHHALDVDAR